MSKYVTAIRKLKNNLLFESKFEGKKQQLDIAEGDINKDILEVWLETISGTISRAISREKNRIKGKKS